MKPNSRRLAAAAVFAALYAVLRLVPVSPLIGVSSSLTMGEVFSPLAGMILGPFAGGLSILLGTFLTALMGRPLVFDGLDFIPGVFAAVTAGLAMRGRPSWAVAISIALITLYTLDPLSATAIVVSGVSVPFLWMHVISAVTMMLVAWRLRGSDAAFNPLFIAAVVFISTMNAHVSGSIMFENVLVRINRSMTPSAIAGAWKFVFFAYPFERTFFVIVGSILAIPILRTLPRNTLDMLRGGSAS